MKRRQFLVGLGAAAAAGSAARCVFPRLARPADPEGPLSSGARRLLDAAWAGLDPAKVIDSHVHLVGLGAGGTGCYVNAKSEQYLRHPVQHLKFAMYRAAAGIRHEDRADAEYVDRLVSLVRAEQPHGRLLLLAFDQAYGEDGKPRPDDSEFYTPNEWALSVARDHPDCFIPAASVHPYRPDAVAELEKAVAGGAAAVKWLPSAQQIDPSSPRCDPLYQAMARLGVPLLSHAGEELAVDGADLQRLGNPLHLRRALDHGVKVIVAHCASLGQSPDLDAPGQPPVDSFDLFLRLMAEPRYASLLCADVSALPQVNRCGRPLAEMLVREDLHPRLLNGSDYPLPAINVLFRTGKLESLGYLSAEERGLLNEIDQHNPLLFDFALKRSLKVVRDGKVHRFAPEVFTHAAGFLRLS